jgi:hypothetical protein
MSAEATAESKRESAPLSVGIALGCLAAFIALRGADLQLTWGTWMFWGALFTIAITGVFAVGLMRGDKRAWQISRWIGFVLIPLLVAAPFLGYPQNPLRLFAMAGALLGMVIALSMPSAKLHYRIGSK